MEHFTPSEAPIHETQRLPVVPPAQQIIGRNQELGQTFAQIRAGLTVMLHGPGGVGKSALAATIAAAFTSFPGGVLWWPVDGASLESLVARLGRAYGKRAISDSPQPLDHLAEAAGLLACHNRPLVVLDGRLAADVARDFVRKLADGVPVMLLNEAGGAGPWTPYALGPLADADALALFMRAAGLAADDLSTIARANIQTICNRLGRLPLALRLAGLHMRISEQTPGDFLELLGMAADADDPHLPGLAEIYAELPDALQGMLLVLGATFAGRATLPLLEYLHLSPPETIARVMEMLVQRGLVEQAPGQGEGGGYYLHDLVFAFVQDWLREAGHLPALLARARDALVTFAEENSVPSREARTRLIAEMPNIMSLARWADGQDDQETIRRLYDALASAFSDTGGYGYELHLLRQLAPPPPPPPPEPEPAVAEVDAPEDVQATLAGLQQMAFPGMEQAPPAAPEPPPVAQPVPDPVQPAAGLDDYDTIPLRPLAREASGPPPEKIVDPPPAPAPPEPDPAPPVDPAPVGAVPATAPVAQEIPPAEPPIEQDSAPAAADDEPVVSVDVVDEDDELVTGPQALWQAIIRARQDERFADLAELLAEYGYYLIEDHQPAAAQETFREALALYEGLQDFDGMMEVLGTLAELSVEADDLEKAVVYATRAENLAGQLDDQERQGALLALLADLRIELGETDEAVLTYARAVEALRHSNDALQRARVQSKLGHAYMNQGSYAQAIPMYTQALAVFEQAGEVDFQGYVLSMLGIAYGRSGQWAQAEAHHQQALALARQVGDLDEMNRQLTNLIYIAEARGDRAAMFARYRRALDLGFQAQEVAWQVRYLDGLGRFLMDDVSRVAFAVRLLAVAQALAPDDERERIIRRAQTRLERMQARGMQQAPVPEDIPAWAEAWSRAG